MRERLPISYFQLPIEGKNNTADRPLQIGNGKWATGNSISIRFP
jgi:hypothetical protein